MEVVHARCCGLDVHKRTVVACRLTPGAGGRPRREVRTFGTMVGELEDLAAWLADGGCTIAALESTGVYWQPVWDVLEGRFALLLVNARHVKQVPGRKTDVRDCEWLAELLRHGLLHGSAVPERARRELRELTRYRTALGRERVAAINRLQKVLEGAGLKLAASTKVTGVSARAMLAALLAGETDPKALAALARGRLRAKRAELERALAGRFGPHQRYLVAKLLAHLDYLDGELADLDGEVAERLRPHEAELARLDTIPGVGRRTAEVLLAELGADVGRFPTAAHCASWAGMCPGSDESAGKRRSGKTRKGNTWLRAALVEAAKGAGRTKATYLGAQYRRLAARRGQNKAAVAVGHSILVIAYHLLKTPTLYRDLGPDHFERLAGQAGDRRLIRRLEARGYTVTRTPQGDEAA